LKTYRS